MPAHDVSAHAALTRRKGLKSPPFFGKDDKLPVLVAVVMGLQHALAMMGGLVTPPTLISNDGCLFGRDPEMCDAKAYMISSALITSGILTIIQVVRFRLCRGYYLGTGLISVMGTSFTFLPIARELTTSEFVGAGGQGGKYGYGKFLGTCLVASLLEVAISFVPPKVLRKLFPHTVTGTCVLLIGASLSGTGMKYWGGGVFCAENSMSRSGPWHANSAVPGPQLCTGENGDTNLSFGDARYVGMGALVLLSMVFVRTFGSPFMKNCIVIIALFFIYLVSLGIQVAAPFTLPCLHPPPCHTCVPSLLPCVHLPPVTLPWAYPSPCQIDGANLVNSAKIELADAITFNWVKTFPLGFAPEYLLPILLAFLVSTVESIGDITGTMDASRLDSTGADAASRIQGGLLADGINSFIAALMTSPPNTTFSQNTGVIEMTRCASRAAGLYCAAWLILFGVIGKFAGVITSIPTCVLGGMVIFLFSNVMISGIAILSKCKFTSRERFILAISLGVGVGVAAQPNFFDPAPSSPAAFCALRQRSVPPPHLCVPTHP